MNILFYKNKSNILSLNGINAILSDINNKNINKNNLIFKLIEVLENIYDYYIYQNFKINFEITETLSIIN